MINIATDLREQQLAPRSNEFAALVFEVELIAEKLRESLTEPRDPKILVPISTDEIDAIHRRLVVAANRALLIRSAGLTRQITVCPDGRSGTRLSMEA